VLVEAAIADRDGAVADCQRWGWQIPEIAVLNDKFLLTILEDEQRSGGVGSLPRTEGHACLW